jgi:uncharacterized protein YjbI with pentapeptide repeats
LNEKSRRDSKQDFVPPPAGDRKSRWGLRGKTVWDWLGLLLVPLVLGLGAAALTAWFNAQQNARQQHIEVQRAKAERKIQQQNAQDEALQAYLDQMGNLLLEKDLRGSKEQSAVRTLARARTLTVLGRLDASRKRAVVQFLAEAQLVQKVDESGFISLEGKEPIISLSGADLSDAALDPDPFFVDLTGANLSEANLSEAGLSWSTLRAANLFEANLAKADLHKADLSGGTQLGNANLHGANLSGASLFGADLGAGEAWKGADLSDADLSGALLFDATLTGVDLSGADLSGAALDGADLLEPGFNKGADLSGADLSNATGWTEAQLSEARSLKGATMPNGQKYEDWLKSKDQEENKKSSGSS